MAEDKKIAVLSGKGGTGKTLISVNLAAAAGSAVYADCDVEEPDGHLFFKPNDLKRRQVCVKIPSVNDALCTGCRACVGFCRFNALAYVGKVMLFDTVCHSCGGCALVCPYNAITEKERQVGIIEEGVSGNVVTVTGAMNPGEASGVPVIKEIVKDVFKRRGIVIMDCAPGSGCLIHECVRAADYCLLVAEPTVFGAHDMAMAHKLVKLLHKPCGAVLNKCEGDINPSEKYCRQNGIEILQKIPYDKQLGIICSEGRIAARESEIYKAVFTTLLDKVNGAGL